MSVLEPHGMVLAILPDVVNATIIPVLGRVFIHSGEKL